MPTEVIIFDKSYKLECAPSDEANLHAAATALETKYREARLAMPRLESERVAGMVALNLSLEFAKLEQQLKKLSAERVQEKNQNLQLIHQLTSDVEAAIAAK